MTTPQDFIQKTYHFFLTHTANLLAILISVAAISASSFPFHFSHFELVIYSHPLLLIHMLLY
jgi:hypothetical protein